MRFREVRPTVGLMPTTLLAEAGNRMLPEVSVPSEANAKPMDEATALPLEEPLGSYKGSGWLTREILQKRMLTWS